MILKAKWNAWNGLGDMSSEEAMANYVMELKKVRPFFTSHLLKYVIDKMLTFADDPRKSW